MAVYFQLDGQQIANALEAIGWQSSGGGSANVVYGTTQPATPFDGQLWFDTSVEKLKMYNGGVWVNLNLTQQEMTDVLTASQTINSSITTVQGIKDSTQAILDGVVASLPTGSISDTIVSATTVYSSQKVDTALKNASSGIATIMKYS